MISYDTDGTPGEERFTQWREHCAPLMSGAVVELQPDFRGEFYGRLTARKFGRMTTLELRASPYIVRRTPEDIMARSSGMLVVGQVMRGPVALTTGHGRSHNMLPGDIALGYSDRPFSADPLTTQDLHGRSLAVPAGEALTLGQPVHDMDLRQLDPHSPLMMPLRALFVRLLDNDEGVGDMELAGIDIIRLALAIQGRLSVAMTEVRSALRRAMLQAALGIMKQEKGNPNLRPDDIAKTLGISRRQLFVLFEDTELTFSQTLSMKRIRAARKLLAEKPALPIIDVAYSCGFESLATFYRIFSNVYGVAPRELRLVEANLQNVSPKSMM